MAATGNSGTEVWNLETGRIDYADPEFRRGAGLFTDGCGLVTDGLRVRDIRPWSHGEKRVTNCLQENSPAAKE